MPTMFNRRHAILSGSSALIGMLALSGHALAAGTARITRSEDEWRALLTPAQYAALRLGETEEPYSSPLETENRRGIFSCAACGSALFPSRTKFDSHTGWPSFWQPLDDAVLISRDRSQGLIRTKMSCRRCGSHIGHVFGDGPPPTNLRYCANGAGLTFKPV